MNKEVPPQWMNEETTAENEATNGNEISSVAKENQPICKNEES